MSHLIYIAGYLTCMIEMLSFYYVIFGKRLKLRKKKGSWLLRLLAVQILFVIATIYSGAPVLQRCVLYTGVVLLAYAFYSIPLRECIGLFCVSRPLLVVQETIIVNFFVYFLDAGNKDILAVVSAGLSCVLLWLYYLLVGRKLDRDAFILGFYTNLMLGIVLFIVANMIVFCSNILPEVWKRTSISFFFEGAVVILTACAVVVATLLLMYFFNAQRKGQLEKEVLNRYNKMQKKYFQALLRKEKKTRQFRHDTIAELTAIQHYIEKGEYVGAQTYVAEMLQELNAISRHDYAVGNEVFNVLLNYYLQPVKNSCLVEVSGHMGELPGISDRDLCILASNLLKNAVEEVERLDVSGKRIAVHVRRGKLYTHIIQENTCDPLKKSFISTKEDEENHGFGLKHISRIVGKYGGEFTYQKEGGIFRAEILLKHSSTIQEKSNEEVQ